MKSARRRRQHAAARGPDARGLVRHLQLQRRRRRADVNLLQLAADNGQLATVDPTVARTLANIQAATTQQGGVSALNNPLVRQYTWSMPTRELQSVADRARGLRDHAEPSTHRVVQLPAHQLDARHDQQRAVAIPELTDRPAASSRRGGRRRSRCGRPSATAW